MTAEKKNKTAGGQKAQKELSQTRKKMQGRSKYRSTRKSNNAVEDFFEALNKSPSAGGREVWVVIAPKGAGRFLCIDNSGTEKIIKLKSGLRLPGKLHHNPMVTTAIGPGSNVVVKDDEIVGVLSLQNATRAKKRMGWGVAANKNANLGFNWNVSNERYGRVRSSKSRSRSKSRERKLKTVHENNRGNNNNNNNNDD